jgi:two-component system sensor kinase FixL
LFSNTSILIIDDDEDFHKSLRRLLRLDGYEVEVASSVKDAVAKGSLEPFSLILLDRRLPDGIAEEILPYVKSLAPNAAIIVMTGYADLESTIEAFRLGAEDFLTKPINHDLLRRTISRNLELKQSKATLQNHALILRNVHDAVISTNVDGLIETWNSAAERVYGYTQEEAIGREIEFIFLPEDQHRFQTEFLPALEANGTFETILHGKRQCGAHIEIHLRLTQLCDDSGNVRGIIACSNDITEERRLQRQLLRISEDEKRRIGQDLHDDLCQQLGGIACVAKAIQTSLEGDNNTQAQSVGEITRMVNDASAQARAIARGFMPVALESEGLLAAIRELAATTEKLHRVSCQTQLQLDLSVSIDCSVQVYRIFQEAVSNAIKHGHASEIILTLTKSGDEIIGSIKDNGTGIAPESRSKGGMGLVTMDLRSKVIGGHLSVEKLAAGGTAVVCTIPISKTRPRAHDKFSK